MDHETRTTETAGVDVYADAPRIVDEMCWVAAQCADRRLGVTLGRAFLLRKTALIDRIALFETATYAPDVAARAVRAAEESALALVEYDAEHRGLSRRALELVTGADCRTYVREQYGEWSRAQRS
ncbi:MULTISPECIES: hypothetical protein [Streptomyces]|uniref:Uncharacterized protein n=1 Tax=Streptomyces xinghaiensis TaxID=1038928 RepID=A0A3R7I644_9ACTN|nr:MULTISPECIES: hypothetical protein [Streptomyces]OFA37728.1 hypothetical protein BEN35_28655 [Streptomyces fradiae]PQM23196.1 hypothetical protein Sfr7A_11400 [Streptomyces xinghaiensis]RKM94756.1 hypothetical protein SFRA_015860 [Streptomyces xinghaiensis]RNC74802.1 hypothetical protein DC095_009090 [Streptomyces xinghaiensis]